MAEPPKDARPKRRARKPVDAGGSPDALWRSWLDRWVWGEAAVDVWVGSQLDRERLAARRDERIAATVVHAVRNAPFYRELYREALGRKACDALVNATFAPPDPGGPAAADPLAALAGLPVVTRRALMARFDDSVTDPLVTRAGVTAFLADPARAGEPFIGGHAIWTSSGTSGEPGIFVHDPHALAVYDALEAVRFRRLTSLPAAAAAAMSPARYALVGATGGHFAGVATIARMRRASPWLASRLAVMSVLDPIDALVDALNRFSPGLLATYPSAAMVLADEQRAGRLRLRLQELWTGGETLSPEARTYIRAAFDCPVRDDYGASEFLPIAWECDLGSLHVNEDWVVLEAVDRTYAPVPDDTLSDTVLLTNLANRVQPLVRYDLGDRIRRHARPCACGCAMPVISVEGRADDTLVLPGRHGKVRIIPLALGTVIEDIARVEQWQVVQTTAEHLVVRMPGGTDDDARWDTLHRTLAGWLAAQGVVGVTITRERTPPERDPRSGKMRHVMRGPDLRV